MNKIILNHMPADNQVNNQVERNYKEIILRKILILSVFVILIVVVSLIIFCKSFYYNTQNHINIEMLGMGS